MIEEIWKDVIGYEGLYKVSNYGNIKNTINDKIIKQTKRNDGYLQVYLYKNNKRKDFRVHRLVFEAFNRRLLPNEVVHHLSHIKTQNQITNLVAKDNRLHSKEHVSKRIVTEQTKRKMSITMKSKWEKGQYQKKQKDPITGRFV